MNMNIVSHVPRPAGLFLVGIQHFIIVTKEGGEINNKSTFSFIQWLTEDNF